MEIMARLRSNVGDYLKEKSVISVSPESTFEEVVAVLINTKTQRVYVLNKGSTGGVISQYDVISTLYSFYFPK